MAPRGIKITRAVSYMDRYDDKSPKEALGMFRSRIRRVWGHAAIFTWSDLILDRSRKLVGLQSPAACATRMGGDSDPNFRELRPLPRPVPGHRVWGSRPFVASEPGCRRQVLAFRVECKGALVGSVARWPLGGIKK